MFCVGSNSVLVTVVSECFQSCTKQCDYNCKLWFGVFLILQGQSSVCSGMLLLDRGFEVCMLLRQKAAPVGS